MHFRCRAHCEFRSLNKFDPSIQYFSAHLHKSIEQLLVDSYRQVRGHSPGCCGPDGQRRSAQCLSCGGRHAGPCICRTRNQGADEKCQNVVTQRLILHTHHHPPLTMFCFLDKLAPEATKHNCQGQRRWPTDTMCHKHNGWAITSNSDCLRSKASVRHAQSLPSEYTTSHCCARMRPTSNTTLLTIIVQIQRRFCQSFL